MSTARLRAKLTKAGYDEDIIFEMDRNEDPTTIRSWLYNFGGSTMNIIKVICENNARPVLKNVWDSALSASSHYTSSLSVTTICPPRLPPRTGFYSTPRTCPCVSAPRGQVHAPARLTSITRRRRRASWADHVINFPAARARVSRNAFIITDVVFQGRSPAPSHWQSPFHLP